MSTTYQFRWFFKCSCSAPSYRSPVCQISSSPFGVILSATTSWENISLLVAPTWLIFSIRRYLIVPSSSLISGGSCYYWQWMRFSRGPKCCVVNGHPCCHDLIHAWADRETSQEKGLGCRYTFHASIEENSIAINRLHRFPSAQKSWRANRLLVFVFVLSFFRLPLAFSSLSFWIRSLPFIFISLNYPANFRVHNLMLVSEHWSLVLFSRWTAIVLGLKSCRGCCSKCEWQLPPDPNWRNAQCLGVLRQQQVWHGFEDSQSCRCLRRYCR